MWGGAVGTRGWFHGRRSVVNAVVRFRLKKKFRFIEKAGSKFVGRRKQAIYLDSLEGSECVLAGVGNVKESVFILVLLVDTAHQGRSRRQNLIHEDEDGLLG